MALQSAIGMFIPGMYAKDTTWAKAVFLGSDLVNYPRSYFILIQLPREVQDAIRATGQSFHDKASSRYIHFIYLLDTTGNFH